MTVTAGTYVLSMTEATWDSLAEASHEPGDGLEPEHVPDAPGVYVWWRDEEPIYLDCARRLRVRLTRIDTHVAGKSKQPSTLRSRVRLLLRERDAIRESTDAHQATALVNSWVGRCSVSWVRTQSHEEAQEKVLDLLHQRRPELHIWRPRYGEDQWLLEYVERLGGRDAAGKIYVEVPIGGRRYGRGAKTRYIDAVRLPGIRPGGIHYYHQRDFEDDLRDQPVEVIEVKKSLNRTVIGQLIVAHELARAEWPSHDSLRLVALCTAGDPALEWICKQQQIDLEVVGRT